MMTYKELDFIFPFIVLAYGALITFVLNTPALIKIAEKRLNHDLLKQMNAHRQLAFVCLIIGGIWSLQNLWVG